MNVCARCGRERPEDGSGCLYCATVEARVESETAVPVDRTPEIDTERTTAFQLTPAMLDELERAAEAAQAASAPGTGPRGVEGSDVLTERAHASGEKPAPSPTTLTGPQASLRALVDGRPAYEPSSARSEPRSLRALERRPQKSSRPAHDAWVALSTMPGFSIADQQELKVSAPLDVAGPARNAEYKPEGSEGDARSKSKADAGGPLHPRADASPSLPDVAPLVAETEEASFSLPAIRQTISDLKARHGADAGGLWTWPAYAIRASQAQRSAANLMRVLAHRASLLDGFRCELTVVVGRRAWEQGRQGASEVTWKHLEALAEKARITGAEYEDSLAAHRAIQRAAEEEHLACAAELKSAQDVYQAANRMYRTACLSRDMSRGELASNAATLQRLSHRMAVLQSGGPDVDKSAEIQELAELRSVAQQRQTTLTAVLADDQESVRLRQAEQASSHSEAEDLRRRFQAQGQARQERSRLSSSRLGEAHARAQEVDEAWQPLFIALGEEALVSKGGNPEHAAWAWLTQQAEADARLREQVERFLATINHRAAGRGSLFWLTLLALPVGIFLWYILS